MSNDHRLTDPTGPFPGSRAFAEMESSLVEPRTFVGPEPTPWQREMERQEEVRREQRERADAAELARAELDVEHRRRELFPARPLEALDLPGDGPCSAAVRSRFADLAQRVNGLELEVARATLALERATRELATKGNITVVRAEIDHFTRERMTAEARCRLASEELDAYARRCRSPEFHEQIAVGDVAFAKTRVPFAERAAPALERFRAAYLELADSIAGLRAEQEGAIRDCQEASRHCMAVGLKFESMDPRGLPPHDYLSANVESAARRIAGPRRISHGWLPE